MSRHGGVSARGSALVAAGSVACLLAAPWLLFDGLVARRAVGQWQGDAFVLQRAADDPHFRIEGAVNGVPVVYLVDTGASVTTVPAHNARDMALGNCRRVELRTANGKAMGCEARADAVDVGPFRLPDAPVIVANQLDEALLGMSVLQYFDVVHSGRSLRLTPKDGAPVGPAVGEITPRPAVAWLPVALLFGAGMALAALWFRHSAR